MRVAKVFVSVNAEDFAGLSDWWSQVMGRRWDREPMPGCHEWDLTSDVLFQVIDDSDGRGSTSVSLLVADLDAEISRLASLGVPVPEPGKVQGFDTLRIATFADPEGNPVHLLDGA